MKKRSKTHINKKTKGIIGGLSIIIILLFSFYKIDNSIRPVARIQAVHFAEKTANEVIESTLTDYLTQNKYTYPDFAVLLLDEDKKVSSIEMLSYNINKVQAEVTLKINQSLERNGKRSTQIPFGSLTDNSLLIGKGPKLKINVSPVGSASVELKSDFREAGINQTCHTIYAVIKVKMSSSVPMYSYNTETELKFLIAENIVVGQIPYITAFSQK